MTGINKAGMFCAIGPTSSFICMQNLPPELEFNPNTVPPSFRSIDGEYDISVEDVVRVRVIGVKISLNEVNSMATMDGDELGLIQDTD